MAFLFASTWRLPENVLAWMLLSGVSTRTDLGSDGAPASSKPHFLRSLRSLAAIPSCAVTFAPLREILGLWLRLCRSVSSL